VRLSIKEFIAKEILGVQIIQNTYLRNTYMYFHIPASVQNYLLALAQFKAV